MTKPAPDVPPGRRSALLVAVPAAERAVAEHRARLDSSARDGVPAHLTVRYPFLPHLPIEATATEVTLMAGPPPGDPDSPPDQWRRLASFPLG